MSLKQNSCNFYILIVQYKLVAWTVSLLFVNVYDVSHILILSLKVCAKKKKKWTSSLTLHAKRSCMDYKSLLYHDIQCIYKKLHKVFQYESFFAYQKKEIATRGLALFLFLLKNLSKDSEYRIY